MVKKETKTEDNSKVIDKELGVDYTYLLNRETTDTIAVTPEEVAEEDNELIASFLEANADVKPYIDKAVFDPTGLVARHLINLCKDKDYKVKVGEKEYRLPQAILLKAFSDAYNYVQGVAKALADKSGAKNCIQLSDDDVYAIAENYFKLGGKSADIRITNETKKSAKKTPSAKPKGAVSKISSEKSEETDADNIDDLPYEIKDDEASEPSVVEEEHKATQISFFDL